jgi:hypothetical protein
VGVKVDYMGGINLINTLNSGEVSKQLSYILTLRFARIKLKTYNKLKAFA